MGDKRCLHETIDPPTPGDDGLATNYILHMEHSDFYCFQEYKVSPHSFLEECDFAIINLVVIHVKVYIALGIYVRSQADLGVPIPLRNLEFITWDLYL